MLVEEIKKDDIIYNVWAFNKECRYTIGRVKEINVFDKTIYVCIWVLVSTGSFDDEIVYSFLSHTNLNLYHTTISSYSKIDDYYTTDENTFVELLKKYDR